MSLARDLSRLEAQRNAEVADREAAAHRELWRYLAAAGGRLVDAGVTVDPVRTSKAEADAETALEAARRSLTLTIRSGADDTTVLTHWRTSRIARIRRNLLRMCAGRNGAPTEEFGEQRATVRNREHVVPEAHEVPGEVPSAVKGLS